MKKIAVVALDPLAGASYTKEVRDLFGEYAEVVGYSVRDGSAAGVLPRADLFAIYRCLWFCRRRGPPCAY